jgi:flagellin-like hook-associated protein FlgL
LHLGCNFFFLSKKVFKVTNVIANTSNQAATYLADRVGVRGSALASTGSEASSESATSLSTDSVTISSLSDTSFLVLRDTLDERYSEVAVVQIANADLEALSAYLVQIRDVYESLGQLAETDAAFDETKDALAALEVEMSAFIGGRSKLTTDVALIVSQESQETQLPFSLTSLPGTESLGNEELFAVLEVDLGALLSAEHAADSCPICAAQAKSSPLFSELVATEGGSIANGASGDALINPNEAPAQNNANVTGFVASSASADAQVEAIRAGPIWDLSPGETLSYSFYDGNVGYDAGTYGSAAVTYNAPLGATVINAANQQHLDKAFAAWDNAMSFDFEKVVENGTTVGELRSAYTTRAYASATAAAYAYYPDAGVTGGDIWYIDDQATNLDFTPGGYGYFTALHEIGHAVGLSHSFDGSSFGGTNLSAADDIQRNTVMSYTQTDRNKYFEQVGASLFTRSFYAHTPGVIDVAAAEHIYGVNTSSNLGDTTYQWVDTPTIMETLVDSGGEDTIDASNQSRASVIDLTPGNFSSIGIYTVADQVTFWNGVGFAGMSTADLYTGEDNVGIAHSATIENAIGGQGDDIITGNSADNTLTGGAGDDTLGGGTGDDVAVFSGALADYTINTVAGVTTVIANVGTDGTDTLTSVETLNFADLSYSVASGLSSSLPVAASGSGSGSGGGGGSSGGAFDVPRPMYYSQGHSLSSASVRTSRDAQQLIQVVDAALEHVSQQQAAAGAVLNMLDRRGDLLANSLMNAERSRSQIMDTDYAVETTRIAKQMILQETGLAMMQRSTLLAQEVLGLLK